MAANFRKENKMAAHFEVFDKLRNLGKSLDKISHDLRSGESVEEPNKARACLHLRALLTEAKKMKEESSKGINEARARHNLDSVLTLCEQKALKIREGIESLETHLSKYGYKKPAENLPEVSLESFEEYDDESSETTKGSESDKENHSPRPLHEARVEVSDEVESTKSSKPEETDLLATPVRPTTVTRFIQNFKDSDENPTSSPQEYEEPSHPVTTTPLLKYKPDNLAFSTPESLESPAQPQTRTPMIKARSNFDFLSNLEDNPLVDDVPAPPSPTTVGLYGAKARDAQTSVHYDPLKTPPPPAFTSVSRLKPDDLSCKSGDILTSDESEVSFEIEQGTDSEPFQFPDVDYETYRKLPDSLQTKFSFEEISVLVKQTNTYLNSRNEENSTIVTDEQLGAELKLGSFTRAFALAMLKLEYFTIRRSGVYAVADKMMV